MLKSACDGTTKSTSLAHPEDVTMKLKVGDLMKENDDVEASRCYEDEETTMLESDDDSC